MHESSQDAFASSSVNGIDFAALGHAAAGAGAVGGEALVTEVKPTK